MVDSSHFLAGELDAFSPLSLFSVELGVPNLHAVFQDWDASSLGAVITRPRCLEVLLELSGLFGVPWHHVFWPGDVSRHAASAPPDLVPVAPCLYLLGERLLQSLHRGASPHGVSWSVAVEYHNGIGGNFDGCGVRSLNPQFAWSEGVMSAVSSDPRGRDGSNLPSARGVGIPQDPPCGAVVEHEVAHKRAHQLVSGHVWIGSCEQ